MHWSPHTTINITFRYLEEKYDLGGKKEPLTEFLTAKKYIKIPQL